jgi:superfamily II helicase
MIAMTIEATGKQWKGMQAIGTVLITAALVAGFCWPTSVVIAYAITAGIIGLVICFAGSVGAWWHHA